MALFYQTRKAAFAGNEIAPSAEAEPGGKCAVQQRFADNNLRVPPFTRSRFTKRHSALFQAQMPVIKGSLGNTYLETDVSPFLRDFLFVSFRLLVFNIITSP